MAEIKPPKTPTKLNELTKLVKVCDKKYGSGHINLVHEGGMDEGIWAVPADKELHSKIVSDSSRGEFVWVRLVNQPLGWDGATWGGLVKAVTNGKSRPMAKLENQKDEAIVNDRKALKAILTKYREQQEKKKQLKLK